jgi:hypothetical protein
MTAAISQGEYSDEDAWKGLALLRLMAEAADDKGPNWVNRRVEQLEFLDERAVRWRVSVDFYVPEGAPVVHFGGQPFRLVPLTSWEKDNLVAFDLRDETGKAIWLPNSDCTDRLLSSALIFWARDILKRSPGQPDETLTAVASEGKIDETLRGLVSQSPSPGQIARSDPAAVDGYLEKLSGKLFKDDSFRSQFHELWRNFLIVVAVTDLPGTRRVFKMTFESKIEFRRPDKSRNRIMENMGWRPWHLELSIGGRGGSHHLEVAAPPGVDIVRIRARPRTEEPMPEEYVVSYGGSPHVHLRIKSSKRWRYLATIRVRVSRPGWLTMSWLAGLVIATVLVVGGLDLSTLFSAVPETGTAAGLLLALLAVFATVLVGPGAHPLASRLLSGSRYLIVVDSGAVLLAVGLLLLWGRTRNPPTCLWWPLAALAGLLALGLTAARIFPAGPDRVIRRDQEKSGDDKKEKPEEPVKLDERALAIPAADGYHYGDTHGWTNEQQGVLAGALRNAEKAAFRSAALNASGGRDPARSLGDGAGR